MKNAAIFLCGILISVLLCACAPEQGFKSEADERLYRSIESGGDISDVISSVLDGANIDKLSRGRLVSVNMVDFAAKNGRVDAALWLLENGADTDFKTSIMGQTLLMSMAEIGQYELCQALINNGADVLAEDRLSDTALEYAVRSEGKEAEIDRLVTLLLESGAQIRRETLDAAITGFWGKGDSRYGLVHRVAVALRDAGKRTGMQPWLEAAVFADGVGVSALMDSGRVSVSEQEQMLFFTAAFGSANTLRHLEEKGFNLKLTDKDGNTPLILAARYGNTEAVRFLLSTPQDFYAENRYGKSALDEAGNEEIRLLLEANMPARETSVFGEECTCSCCR